MTEQAATHIESLLTDVGAVVPDVETSAPPPEANTPKAEAEPAEAGEPEVKEGEQPPEKKRTVVSHAALHEERTRRKELQAKLERESEERRRLEDRLTQLQSALQAPKQESEYTDPLELVAGEITQLKGKLEAKEKGDKEAQEQASKEAEFRRRYAESAKAFAQDKPDFIEAYNHLLTEYRAELEEAGYGPDEVGQELLAREKALVERAYQNEKNPAEVIYQIASRRGYKVKQAASAAQDIAQVQKTVAASKSLGGGGGKPDVPVNIAGLSTRDLIDMPEAEFYAIVEKMKRGK